MAVQSLEKVENIVTKGEIAHHEQFLLLPQCFQKSSAADASNCVGMWNSAKHCLFPCHDTKYVFNRSLSPTCCFQNMSAAEASNVCLYQIYR